MKIQRETDPTRKPWRLSYYAPDGSRKRQWFDNKAQAEAEAKNQTEQRRTSGDLWLSTSADERNELMSIYQEVKKAGLKMRQVWEGFKSGKSKVTVTASRTLKEAIEELKLAKRFEGCTERYIDSLDEYLYLFARGRESLPVASIAASDLQGWFSSRNEAPSAKKSNLGRLSALFSYAVAHKYAAENPCDAIGKIRVDTKPPTILTYRQILRVIAASRKHAPEFLPFIVLSLFAGVRPEEVTGYKNKKGRAPLTWAAIDFKRERLTVTGKRITRIVKLEPAALSWLEWCKDQAGAKDSDEITPFSHPTFKRYRQAVRYAAKIEWTQDVLRHTATSYLVAKIRSVGEAALRLGNSERTIKKHYLNLVDEDDAAKFYALRPQVAALKFPQVQNFG